jgi:hypothetical protein
MKILKRKIENIWINKFWKEQIEATKDKSVRVARFRVLSHPMPGVQSAYPIHDIKFSYLRGVYNIEANSF